ncbi:tyrosine-type recombinase/integrase, partial [candidate division KSB1 bacterium]
RFNNHMLKQVELGIIAKKTYTYYYNFLQHIVDALGAYKMSQITIEDIEKYINNRRTKNRLAISTLRGEYLTWNKLFNYAEERGFCKENLMQYIKKPTKAFKRLSEKRPFTLSESQIELLVISASPYLSEIISFLFNTGLRKGELENLRFKDVDLRKKVLKIRSHANGWQPKNGRERIIPLNTIAYSILVKKTELRNENQEFVFLSTTGKKAYHYHKSFQKLMKKTGLADIIPGEHWKGVHLLRHSFCSYLVNEAQVPLPIAQEIMGHQDIKTTMMYVHTDERQKQKAIRKFDYIREFQKLRKDGKSVDEVLRIIADKFNMPLNEVEDVLIGMY